MRTHIALLSAAAMLAACAPSNPAQEAPPPTAAQMPAGATDTPTPAAAADASVLAASHWHLDSAVDAAGERIGALFPAPDRRLQLEFAEGRVSVSGGCNRMSGDYTLAD